MRWIDAMEGAVKFLHFSDGNGVYGVTEHLERL
jgi:hypothetical protein